MRRLAIAWLALLLLAGCQSAGGVRDDIAAPYVALAAYDDPSSEAPPELPLPSSEAEELSVPPVTTGAPLALSLQDAATLALAQNPDLITARQAEGVSLGALGVAQTYPFNPSVQIQVTPDPRLHDGSIGSTAHYVLLMQTLQLAHQRQHRTAAAASTLNGTRWNIVQAELQTVALVERLYFAALYQRALRDLTRKHAEVNRELLAISQKQLEGGQISAADVAIIRLDESATRRRADLAAANYQTALLDLRRQLNVPLATPLALAGSLADFQFAPAAGDAQLLASSRPDVLAAQSDFDAARANLGLAHANRVPDLQIGPYYQHGETGTTFWGLRAQSDLPVVNGGLPLVRQRSAEMVQRQTAWEQLSERAAREAEAAIDRYERARRLVAELGTTSDMPAELTKLEELFKAGEVDIVRLVTARTSLIQARQAQLESLHELAQSAAALTAATGLPPEALITSGDGPR